MDIYPTGLDEINRLCEEGRRAQAEYEKEQREELAKEIAKNMRHQQYIVPVNEIIPEVKDAKPSDEKLVFKFNGLDLLYNGELIKLPNLEMRFCSIMFSKPAGFAFPVTDIEDEIYNDEDDDRDFTHIAGKLKQLKSRLDKKICKITGKRFLVFENGCIKRLKI